MISLRVESGLVTSLGDHKNIVLVDLPPWDSKGDYHSLIGMADSLENLPRNRSPDLIVGILENEKFRASGQNFIHRKGLIDHPAFMGKKLGLFQSHSGVIFNQDSQQDLIFRIGVDVLGFDVLDGAVVWAKVFGVRQRIVGHSNNFFSNFLVAHGLNGDKHHQKWQEYLQPPHLDSLSDSTSDKIFLSYHNVLPHSLDDNGFKRK